VGGRFLASTLLPARVLNPEAPPTGGLTGCGWPAAAADRCSLRSV